MGAVWPFVTGFVALGHYRYARPWAGYPLVDALGAMAFDWARGRHPELLSGAYYRPLDTAVPQQFFATSMLVSPVVYGLLGFEPDAPAGCASARRASTWRSSRSRAGCRSGSSPRADRSSSSCGPGRPPGRGGSPLRWMARRSG
jgi:hypothetical protein